jgi:hypothetical protein
MRPEGTLILVARLWHVDDDYDDNDDDDDDDDVSECVKSLLSWYRHYYHELTFETCFL